MATNNSTTPRGRPATRQQTRYREETSPLPPRDLQNTVDNYNIHALAEVPAVNYGNYWQKRQELIDKYKTDVQNLKDFFETKSLELYWKFYFQHLQLSAQRDFNTEVNRWMEELEDSTLKKKEASTQTLMVVIRPPQLEQTQLVPVRPKFVPIQPKPIETTTINKALHGSQPAISLGRRYDFHPYSLPQQLQAARTTTPPEQPQPSTSTYGRKTSRRQRRMEWKKEHPNYSYPSFSSSSGSDTEPLEG